MKRTLSLLLALVMVISMIPAVFAETTDDPEIEFDELLCKHIEKKYTDNGDGTHKVECSACDEFEPINEPHADTDSNNVCDACEAALVPTDPTLTLYRAKETDPYASMMLGNEIKVSVNVAKFSYNYDDYYIEFAINNNGIKTTKALPTGTSDEWYANFQYAVPAPLLTETISATVYGIKDGVTYCGATVTFAVRDSIVARLNAAYPKYDTNPTAKKQFDMYINMLKYAAEAQIRFRVNEDKLATDGIQKEYLDLIKTDAPAYNKAPAASGGTLYLYNLRVKLQEKINLYGNFLFMSGFTKIDDYSVVVEHTKADGTTVSHTITSNGGGLSWDGAYYLTFNFNELAPAQLRDQLTITLYKNGVAATETYTRTGDMAIADTAADLRNAILNFADCAKAYFG